MLERLLKLRCITGLCHAPPSHKVFVNLHLDFSYFLITTVIVSHKREEHLLTQTVFAF